MIYSNPPLFGQALYWRKQEKKKKKKNFIFLTPPKKSNPALEYFFSKQTNNLDFKFDHIISKVKDKKLVLVTPKIGFQMFHLFHKTLLVSPTLEKTKQKKNSQKISG